MELTNSVILLTILTIVIVLILIKVYIKWTTGRCTSDVKLNGKTVIITGANSGIGKRTALDLASRGAKVILACRNLEAAQTTANEIIQKTGNQQVSIQKLDLQSLESIREFSKNIHDTETRLDVLINNAGASYLGNELTEDNLLIGMQVNHFGPFLLTNLLLDLLIKSAPSRIVTVSSMLHIFAKLDINNLNKTTNSDFITYCNSKLFNILMSNELAKRLKDVNVTSNSLHPGVIRTHLLRKMPAVFRIFMELIESIYCKTPTEGAQTSIHLAVAEEVENISGKYFQDCDIAKCSRQAKNEDLAKKLWEISEKAVNLQPNEIFAQNVEK